MSIIVADCEIAWYLSHSHDYENAIMLFTHNCCRLHDQGYDADEGEEES